MLGFISTISRTLASETDVVAGATVATTTHSGFTGKILALSVGAVGGIIVHSTTAFRMTLSVRTTCIILASGCASVSMIGAISGAIMLDVRRVLMDERGRTEGRRIDFCRANR